MYNYILLVFLSFLGVLLYKHIAIKKNIIDVPNERSSHSIPTPRGAGIVVAFLWYLLLCYMYFIEKIINTSLFYSLLGGFFISLIGIVDDIWNISPKVRLFVQIFVAAWSLYFLGGLKVVDLGFYSIESIWILTPLAFVMVIWFINIFNFLDGIDGYLGTEGIIIFSFVGLFYSDSLSLSMVAILMGFLIHNWPKAKVFMGDVGSTLLGFTVAVYALYYQNTGRSSIIIWIMLSSLFWFDATLTLFRRLRNNEKIMVAHKKHAYQRIVQAGFSHQKTLIFSIFINFIILGMVYFSIKYRNISVILFLLNIFMLYSIDWLIGQKRPFLKE